MEDIRSLDLREMQQLAERMEERIQTLQNIRISMLQKKIQTMW